MNIKASKLGVSAGRIEILKSLEVRLNKGEFVGILGPSGCGKSTLLNVLSGRKKASSGEILYDGDVLTGRPGQTIGLVPQDDTLHMGLKTKKTLTYTARLLLPDRSRDEIDKLVDLTLRSVDLQERKNIRVKKLSGGQRKRVSIALELLTSPKALFLDEPTSGLDPELERSVMKLCSRLSKEGRLVVMTTHILESIEFFDRLMILCKGELAFFGTPDEAMDYFDVKDPHHIYPLLAKKTADKFASKYKATLLYRKYFP